jgi:D-proline reductase (dithiol) PrdB
VLARELESAGLSTILVTMMPHWAEMLGTPRTLGVEFPFACPLGQPNNRAQQMRVIGHALSVLETAEFPGEIIHSDEKWPEPVDLAIRGWQPQEPSPIVAVMGPHIRQLLRERRRKN